MAAQIIEYTKVLDPCAHTCIFLSNRVKTVWTQLMTIVIIVIFLKISSELVKNIKLL
jgi:hypothetical protein